MFEGDLFSDATSSGNSLERIQQYLSVEHEPEPTPGGVPPAYWPASGDLRVQNLSARYSDTGPNVLRELSFEIKSGERVGIVGRTGSGKVGNPFDPGTALMNLIFITELSYTRASPLYHH